MTETSSASADPSAEWLAQSRKRIFATEGKTCPTCGADARAAISACPLGLGERALGGVNPALCPLGKQG